MIMFIDDLTLLNKLMDNLKKEFAENSLIMESMFELRDALANSSLPERAG